MFQLSKSEYDFLMSQFVTSSWGGAGSFLRKKSKGDTIKNHEEIRHVLHERLVRSSMFRFKTSYSSSFKPAANNSKLAFLSHAHEERIIEQ